MRKTYLHIGTNEGDRSYNLAMSIHFIKSTIGQIVAKSDVYLTEAWGKEDQPDFYNQSVIAETMMDPQLVLRMIKKIEHSMGRSEELRWGPRVIDIDIIFYDDWIVNDRNLNIPHSMMHERKFVLVPLDEIASDFIHPRFQKTISNLLDLCSDNKSVTKLKLSV